MFNNIWSTMMIKRRVCVWKGQKIESRFFPSLPGMMDGENAAKYQRCFKLLFFRLERTLHWLQMESIVRNLLLRKRNPDRNPFFKAKRIKVKCAVKQKRKQKIGNEQCTVQLYTRRKAGGIPHNRKRSQPTRVYIVFTIFTLSCLHSISLGNV